MNDILCHTNIHVDAIFVQVCLYIPLNKPPPSIIYCDLLPLETAMTISYLNDAGCIAKVMWNSLILYTALSDSVVVRPATHMLRQPARGRNYHVFSF